MFDPKIINSCKPPQTGTAAIKIFVSFSMVLTSEIYIDKPADEVWEIMTDRSLFIKWQQGYESTVQISGQPGEAGSKSSHVYIDKNKKFTYQEELISVEPNKRIEQFRENPVLSSKIITSLQEKDTGTLLKMSSQVNFKAFSLKLFTPFLKNSFLIRQNDDLNRLKILVESAE